MGMANFWKGLCGIKLTRDNVTFTSCEEDVIQLGDMVEVRSYTGPRYQFEVESAGVHYDLQTGIAKPFYSDGKKEYPKEILKKIKAKGEVEIKDIKECVACYEKIFKGDQYIEVYNEKNHEKIIICEECNSLIHNEYDVDDYDEYEVQIMIAHILNVLGVD